MKISFHGAARTVTGSKHIIHLENGKKILLDCGLFQGMGADTVTLNNTWGFAVADISCIVLSHAHIDHVGLLPKLVKEGFAGKIFCTPATMDIAQVLLLDAAHIQDADTKFVNKKKYAQKPAQALYTADDVLAINPLFVIIEYYVATSILPNVMLTFTDAGHILGSAAVHLAITENEKTTRITFSGDVGRYTDQLLRSPQIFEQANYIILESTYGDSLHETFTNTDQLLLQQILHTCVDKKGHLVIPAFSVGRTQELLFILNNLSLQNKLPDIPYYVDSPLSIKVTDLLKKYPNYYNMDVQKIKAADADIFDFKGLQCIDNVEDSKALNNKTEPFVVIASSGMAEAGRIKHHIANNIADTKNTILMSGYCESKSLGGQLLAHNKNVWIFGENLPVNAEIDSLRSMSAHGDYQDLLHFISCQDKQQLKNIFLVHGEYATQQTFAKTLIDNGYANVSIPYQHQLIEL